MADLGFIEAQQRGRGRYIQLSDAKHARLLGSALVNEPSLRYESLLTGKSIDILSAIHLLRLSTIKELEEFSMTSHRTVIRHLREYRELGAVAKKAGRYRLGVRYEGWGELLGEFRSFCNHRKVRTLSEDGVLIWERNREILFRSVQSMGDGAVLSAFSAFPQHGVEIILLGGDYYFYSPRSLAIGPEEAAIHAILAAESPRERTLILMMMRSVDLREDTFLRLGRIYGYQNEADGYLAFLNSEGADRPPGFPTWRTFMTRMEEYS